eukprot:264426_1
MSELIENQCKTEILYITGQNNYNDGVLNNSTCTRHDLWKELVNIKDISNALLNWQQHSKNIEPFRIITHKLHNLKMTASSKNGGMKGKSQCKYFALMWIPNNETNTETQYYNLIDAFRNNKYFCNKLNEECVYISGPEYGDKENSKFDLDSLSSVCRQCTKLPPTVTLEIEVAVHELAREPYHQVNIDNEFDKCKSDTSCISCFNLCCQKPKTHDQDQNDNAQNIDSNTPLLKIDSPLRQRNKINTVNINRAVGSRNSSGHDEIKPAQYGEIYYEKSALCMEYPVFALVWFRVRKSYIDVVKDDVKVEQFEDDEDNSIRLDINESRNAVNSIEIFHELPALSVMKRLHLQPFIGSRVYNVEIFGYEECYENLDLVVDRKIMWFDAFLLFTQFVFLPFFVAIPFLSIIKCFKKDFKLKPRYRQIGDLMPAIAEEILDRTERIPYDICALWRIPTRDKKSWLSSECVFRFVSFLFASILYGIIVTGPILYRRVTPSDDIEYVPKLLFFDCYGPLLFYGLTVFTVIWWTCATQIFILPKEHELLYNKLILNRPMKRKEGNRNIRRTDWAALINISGITALTTFVYAYRKGFFEIRTPTHDLLSCRPVKCNGKLCTKPFVRTVVFISLVIVYFCMQNLENFMYAYYPFYISVDDEYHAAKLTYCILSNILSLIFVFGFILQWETMFDRIARHLDNVKTLSCLIIRNTYSEYIKLSRIDNILSWLSLERFVKRKGMMLFASLETPLFSLWILTVCSWGATVYSLYEGQGLQKVTGNSIFSNSALATWFILALFSLIQTIRMLWFYGRKFTKETEKQDAAFKSQCGTMQIDDLMQHLTNSESTLEQKRAIQSSQILLQHIVHREIVPKVFGFKFDKLASQAILTAIASTIPTFIIFIRERIDS